MRTYHVHVYRVNGVIETDVEAKSAQAARRQAVEQIREAARMKTDPPGPPTVFFGIVHDWLVGVCEGKK